MRKNFGPKSWLYPMPVLIVGTYDEKGNPIKTQAYWTSEACTDCRVYSNSSRPDYWPEGR